MADPAQTANGGIVSTGLEWFGAVSDTWLKYQDIKTRNDLEHTGDDSAGMLNQAREKAAGVPSWVWMAAAVGVAVLAWRSAR